MLLANIETIPLSFFERTVSDTAYYATLLHMSQISQPQHNNAAAGENRDIGPFRRASYMIDSNFVLLGLEYSDIAAFSFEGTKTRYSFLEGSWTPPTCSLPRQKTSGSRGPGPLYK